MVKQARIKFENHLWYLPERLVPFSLFSDKMNTDEKQQLRRAMLKVESLPLSAQQQMPYSTNLCGKSLKDFIWQDSWALFDLLGIDSTFIKLPTIKWKTVKSFQNAKKAVSNLPFVNDAAERALGLATTINNARTASKNEEELQALYTVISGSGKSFRQNHLQYKLSPKSR